jgi:putative PIN family toxin of toxin-antitoxin system
VRRPEFRARGCSSPHNGEIRRYWKVAEIAGSAGFAGISHVISFFRGQVRIVLDTDALVAALRSDQGASRQLLLAALNREIVVLASVPVMLEYEAVLTRREQLERTGLTVEETNAILDALAAVIEPVTFRFLWRPRLKDPQDEMVLDTAVNGQAHRLATFNVRHLAEAAREFGIRAIPPGEIWRELQGVKHEKK